MQELIKSAGLTSDTLKDPQKRSAAIDEYNARAGGLRALMQGGKLALAGTQEIPAQVNAADVTRYLQFIGAGKRTFILFAAGRATRMKLPAIFDRLGIAGLTGNILSRIHADTELRTLIEAASCGKRPGRPEDLSLLQRQLLQYRYQNEKLIREYPATGVTLNDWLAKASFVVVANEGNREALSSQLAAIAHAGLRASNVFMEVQKEEGGLEVLADGSLKPFSREVWPEGHGKPFMDLRGSGLLQKLADRGFERAIFAQVNDLHLLEDMAHVERWAAADPLFNSGTEMVMEMVENSLSQKGGGIFQTPDGNTVMRDTIAMKAADLEPYSAPKSLSRMFYELTLPGLSKLGQGSLPAYITERTASNGSTVLTREFYSGDASGVLKACAMQQKNYVLNTFKVQSRIPEALEAIRKQDSQPGFKLLQLV